MLLGHNNEARPGRFLDAPLSRAGVTMFDSRPYLRLTPKTADFASRLAAIDAGAIDAAVFGCLRETAETLQLDRIMVWVATVDGGGLELIHHWHAAAPAGGGQVATADWAGLFTPHSGAAEVRSYSCAGELPGARTRGTWRRYDVSAAVVVSLPVAVGAARERLVATFGASVERHWAPETVAELRMVAALVAQARVRSATSKLWLDAQDALDVVRGDDAGGDSIPCSPLTLSAVDLHRPASAAQPPADSIAGQSKALRRVLDQIQQVAATNSTVLLLGETGVGKEILATHLHRLSVRRGRQIVRVNCAAIPSTLIESELFGREKGAYTGSTARQIGRFELADHSTIFLDEIGDLPPEVQVKLLRVLEERQIERLGSPQGVHVDVRIVAATHRKLEERIAQGAFREDLFYRLNVFPITVPPLRERAEDIPSLVWRFVDEFTEAFNKPIEAIAAHNMEMLQRYSWPGNIRELRNVVERAMILASGPRLTIALPPRPLAAGPTPERSVKMVDVERDHVRRVLQSTGWRVRGVGGAAELLGLQPTTLEARMAKLGLTRPQPHG
jgi:DNA-binding NtrC family response regulator